VRCGVSDIGTTWRTQLREGSRLIDASFFISVEGAREFSIVLESTGDSGKVKDVKNSE